MRTLRKIMTGHGSNGASRVVDTHEIEQSGPGNFDITMTDVDPAQPGKGEFPFFPAAGQFIFRLFEVPAGEEKLSREAMETNSRQFFEQVAWDGAQKDTTRHPLMHVTPTTDYVVLLAGEAELILDEGDPVQLKPYDLVVQRATNHAWRATGNTPALFAVLMTGN